MMPDATTISESEPAETVRVRAAVCLRDAQRWYVRGTSGAFDADEMAGVAMQISDGLPLVAFIEADIPLPRVPVVEAAVVDRKGEA